MSDAHIRLLDLIDELDKLDLPGAALDLRTAVARIDAIDERRPSITDLAPQRRMLAARVAADPDQADAAADAMIQAVRDTASDEAVRLMMKEALALAVQAGTAAAKATDWHATLIPAHDRIVDTLELAVDKLPAGITADAALRSTNKAVRDNWLAAEGAVRRWHELHKFAAELRASGRWPIAPLSLPQWRSTKREEWRWRDPIVSGDSVTVPAVLDAVRNGAGPELATPARVLERNERRQARTDRLWELKTVPQGVLPEPEQLEDREWIGTHLAAPEDRLAAAG